MNKAWPIPDCPFTVLRTWLGCIAAAVLGLLPFCVFAANYTFPGALPASCTVISSGIYSCSPLTLAYNDTITIASPKPAKITVNGAMNASNAKINSDFSPKGPPWSWAWPAPA